jgi:hypothetical protein
VWTTELGGTPLCYNRHMTNNQTVRVRIYKKEHDILRRLAVRKSIGHPRVMPIARYPLSHQGRTNYRIKITRTEPNLNFKDELSALQERAVTSTGAS